MTAAAGPRPARRRHRARVLAPAVAGVLAITALTAGCDESADEPTGTASTPPSASSDPGPNPTESDPGPNPTESDPGPNPTESDPGPNDTSDGPQTISGSLNLDDPAGCVTLETEDATLDLRFADYSLTTESSGPVLAGPDGEAIARPGDTVFVSGFAGTENGDCGTRFDVDSLNSVIPAG